MERLLMDERLNRPNLSRSAAADWFAAQGYEHISNEHLEALAARGKGPKYFRVGKYVYYKQDELKTWLAAEILRSAEPRRRRGGAARAA